ncbi:hypothetical protein HN51_036416, partial [Arachis hypogaea]
SKSTFTVEELTVLESRKQNYQVLLNEGKCNCDYGYLQALHIPCRHRFVHPMYRMDTIFNVYREKFRPIGHEDEWPS